MKLKNLLVNLLLVVVAINVHTSVQAQYPGGVSTGTTRGYKVDYFDGTYSNVSQFGVGGTVKSTPDRSAYSNKITGTEFIPVDADYYGLEYTGTLEITTTGTYTFRYSGDDQIAVYIDGVLRGSANNTTLTFTSSLTAGDHTIKVKYYELGGANSAALEFTAGPGISAATDIDGRFVRSDNSKLTAWYKATDASVSANLFGAGIDKVNSLTNKAPDYAGNGNMIYSGSGGAGRYNNAQLVNFNPAVNFDGDDEFEGKTLQKGISLRGATKTMFLVNNYTSNAAQAATWMFYHGDNTNGQRFGFWKRDATGNELAVSGDGIFNASAYTANEPKLLGGKLDQAIGAAASATTNPLYMRHNGNAGSTGNFTLDADFEAQGLKLSNMDGAQVPEAIYYPFALSAIQEQKVNTYLAVKYGITLAQDYINTSGTAIFSLATNTGYSNRIFGIGRELAAEALNQKQSQSQMASLAGYDFLVMSKGAIATTNAANSGTIADGDYLIVGDNNGSLASQTTEIPTTFATTAGCTVNRLTREWKAQVTGNPGAVTIRAGSSAYLFPGNASGLTLLVDVDTDGDFTTGAVSTYPAASVVNGVATFNNVTIPNGAEITFAWAVIAPGGVSNGLTLWSKADDAALGAGNVGQWNDLSPNVNHLTRTASNNVVKTANLFNYNPAISFSGADNQFLSSTSPLGMNGDNTYGEFYVLKGTGVSGAAFDEVITLGGSGSDVNAHRWENPTTTLSGSNYTPFGAGTAANSGTGTVTMAQLGLYSHTASGTQAVLRTNGTVAYTNNTTAGLVLDGSSFRIGTDVFSTDGNGNWNSFQSPELIVYNSALSATDISKINTYLSVKYSIPLDGGNSNYVSSNGTTIWPTHATYKSDIFGIGRDDCSGLMQKQSTAWVESATNNLRIALGSLAADNLSNTSSFAANNQFLMVGHNGLALTAVNTGIPATYTALSCNANRYLRTWKAANTGSVTGVQLIFGSSTSPVPANWSNIQLAIDGDGNGNFTDGTITLLSPATVNGGAVTFNNVTIPDGATFTLLFTIGYPGGINSPATGTATIGGVPYINGAAYTLYTTPGSATRDLIAAKLGTGTDVLKGSGYLNNMQIATVSSMISARLTTNYGIVLKTKVLAPRTGNYQFRAVANTDDQLAVVINDGVTDITALNITAFTNTNVTSVPVISLTAGQYYDLTVYFAGAGTPNTYNLQWDGAVAGTFAAIPDASLFVRPQGPSAWFMSDDNQLAIQADGTNMGGAIWYDLSGNKNHVTGSGDPTYYSTNTTYTRNYNPSIYFTADYFNKTSNYLDGFTYGQMGKSVIAMGANNNNATETIYTGYGNDAFTGSNFGLSRQGGGNAGKLLLYTSGNNLLEPTAFYNSATVTHDIIGGILAANGNASLYANGASRASATLGTAINTRFNDNAEFHIGLGPDYSNSYTQNLNEVLYYPWNLSAIEQQKINSYLAIKWGITLDQTVPTDYLASDGVTKIWNAGTGGVFKYDITGIGRDDCGALNQKQSTSTDGTDIISIGKGAVKATNASNTNAFANDKNFLVFANNNASITTSNTTNMPAGLTGCYVKINREWQVQTVGTPGTVNIEVGKQGLFSINASNYKPVLIISGTAGDYTGATVIMNDSVRRGKAYFSNVNFSNGQYFTLAYINAAPGGVTSNMTVWFNADYDMFTDAAQTTYAENDGDAVASMNNMKFGATIGKVEQVNSGYNPVYRPGKFNYNTGVLFDGVDDVLATTGNVNTTDFRTSTTMTSVLAGYNVGGVSNNVFWYHDDNAGNVKTALERNQAFWGNTIGLSRTPTLTDPEIYTFANTTGTGYRLLSNLKTVGSGLATSTATTNGRFRIGSNLLTGGGNPGNFFLGEFVIYNDDKGAANSTPMRQIHSYLATKYGFTLDSTAVGNAYLASNGTTATYNYTNFWNRITGIGRDDCSAFEQKQSFSQETTGALVKISNDPAGLAATNAANPVTFANNFSFLLFGDNNKSLTWTGVDKVPGNLVRLNRVWRVKETGTVNTVYLQVPASTSSATYKLPAADISTVYLLVSHTGNFKAPDATIEMTPNGTDLSVTYDFADGDYYTFASKKSCIAPAGISDGLTSWYRSDNKGTGAITATTGIITDETGTHTLTRNAAGTATINAGTATTNYNRTLTLSGGAYLEKTGLSESSVVAANQGAFFAVGNTKTALFGLSRASYIAAGVVGTNAIFANTTSASATFDAAHETGKADVWINWQAPSLSSGRLGATVNGYTNFWNGGSLNIIANNTYGLRIGAAYVTAGGAASGSLLAGNNTFLEGFTYNRELTGAELLNLNTYLAIKNGQTLTHNYYSPDYDGTNAATATIYDVSTYGTRVFGVGIDSVGCFSQNQSSSVLPGSMLKMSVDGAILSENSKDMSKFAGDRTYVIAGDDNAAVSSWTTGLEVPAYYTTGNSCTVPQRITREWKVRGLGNDQTVLITIPDASSAAVTKLPVLPAGATKVYMIVNGVADFTTNIGQVEIPMTLNATSKEWEAPYNFPAGAYQYITFVTKPDIASLQPVLVTSGAQEASIGNCTADPYIYYKGSVNTTKAIIAVNPNGNTWSPASLTVDNQGTLTGGGGTFSNAGTGYYQSTDNALKTIRISKRLHTIVAPGSYPVNGGVVVRVYYTDADTMAMLTDPMPGTGILKSQGWFKAETASAQETVNNMVPGDLTAGAGITPTAWGVDQGVKYVEFQVNSFSSFGYYAKTTPYVLPITQLSFNGVKSGETKVNLEWKVANETQVHAYEVEYSLDGINFIRTGTVSPLNTPGTLTYRYTAPFYSPATFYRLKIVDMDGRYKYSDVLRFNAASQGTGSVKIYPNPVVQGNLTIQLDGYDKGATARIIDPAGKTIRVLTLNNGKTRVDVSDLARGLYFLQIQNNNTYTLISEKLQIQ